MWSILCTLKSREFFCQTSHNNIANGTMNPANREGRIVAQQATVSIVLWAKCLIHWERQTGHKSNLFIG